MSRATAAWVAGLIEGEGSIMLTKRGAPVIALTMTDEDVVRRLHDVVGIGSVRLRVTQEGNKNAWIWNVASWRGCVSLLTQILPWMGARRGRAISDVLAAHKALR